MRQIDYIVIHCTAGPQTQRTADIQAMWRGMGWKRPGYHFLYNADGTEERLAPITDITNGVAGHNAKSIHLSYKGGVANNRPVDNRTQAQKDAMWKRVSELMKQFPKAKVVGHRDFSPDKNRDGIIQPNEWMKACPSFSVKQWIEEMTK